MDTSIDVGMFLSGGISLLGRDRRASFVVVTGKFRKRLVATLLIRNGQYLALSGWRICVIFENKWAAVFAVYKYSVILSLVNWSGKAYGRRLPGRTATGDLHVE